MIPNKKKKKKILSTKSDTLNKESIKKTAIQK